jgi:hypothetical protein
MGAGATTLFDDFVGNEQKIAADRQTKSFGRLQIYHQLKFGWLLHGQFSRFCPFEDSLE